MQLLLVGGFLLVVLLLWNFFGRTGSGSNKKSEEKLPTKKEERKAERLTRKHEKIGINQRRGDAKESRTIAEDSENEENEEDGEEDDAKEELEAVNKQGREKEKMKTKGDEKKEKKVSTKEKTIKEESRSGEKVISEERGEMEKEDTKVGTKDGKREDDEENRSEEKESKVTKHENEKSQEAKNGEKGLKDERKNSHGMTVISLMGPPGVGKSALSRHITPDFDIVHVSTGELIRAEVAAKSDIGNEVAQAVANGELVRDEVVAQLIEKKFNALKASPRTAGILLDGFPRRISQAQLLDSGKFDIPHLAAVISVTMPDEILALRRGGRRLCPQCGATYNLHEINQEGYHLKARLPADDGKCSKDGSELVSRPDDDPKIADDRTRVYHEETPAMLEYYREQGVLIEVEKKRQMKHVYKDIKPELEKLVARAQ